MIPVSFLGDPESCFVVPDSGAAGAGSGFETMLSIAVSEMSPERLLLENRAR